MEALIKRFLADAPVKGMAIMEDTVNRILKRKATYILMLVLLSPALLAWPLNSMLDAQTYVNADGDRVFNDNQGDEGGKEVKVSLFAAQMFMFAFDVLHLRFLILIMVLSMGMGLMVDEKEDQTLQLLATAPLTRFEVLFYKYVAGVPLMTGLIWVPVVIFYLIFMGTAGWGAIVDNLGLLGLTLMLVFLACAAYTSVFFAFSTFFKKPMMWGIVYIFLYEFLIGFIPWSFQKMTIIHYIHSAAFPALADILGREEARIILMMFDNNGNDMATPWVVSLIILAMVSISFFALAVAAFRRKDLP